MSPTKKREREPLSISCTIVTIVFDPIFFFKRGLPQSRKESRSGERKVRCLTPVPYGRVLFVFSLILYRTRPYISLLINGIEVGSNQPLKADLTMFQPRISVKIESCTVISLFNYIHI